MFGTFAAPVFENGTSIFFLKSTGQNEDVACKVQEEQQAQKDDDWSS